MPRRTKIVCTLGPSSSTPENIRALIQAGMDVARMNFSHGTHDDHARRIEIVRNEAERAGRTVAVLQDLQGPKIRVGEMEGGGVTIREGERLILTSEPLALGTSKRAYISYDGLPDEVEVGRSILLDDGNLELRICGIHGHEVETEVVVGGLLKSRKGVNLPDLRVSRPSLTDKDLADLEFGLTQEVDYMALSFVRSAADVTDLLSRVRGHGRRPLVVAKIEKPEAVRELDAIVEAADAVMVARGDLGIEMPLAQVPNVQKQIIRACLRAARPVITATQMLESMIENARPTRAEATDVANAVYDGSDALMLSAETASGKHPARVVETMATIIEEAERHRINYDYGTAPGAFLDGQPLGVTDAISLTSVRLAQSVGAAALACLTSSGTTARAIARHRPGVPIYAFTDIDEVVAELRLVWGTEAFKIPFQKDTDAGVRAVTTLLRERGLVPTGSLVVFTAGMPLPEKGSTNMIHVTQV